MGSDNIVLVTGANGLVRRALCAALAASGREFRPAIRAPHPPFPGAIAVGEVGPDTDWRAALEGVRCVVHLVSRTHVLRETAPDPLAEYRRINVQGSLALAQQAVRAGARRLVFMSSIKVNGESTATPFTEDDAPRPEDAYGVSKQEAEEALADVKERIKALRREARQAATLEEQHQIQEKMQKLERDQRRQRQEIFKVEDEIMGKRDELIDALERRLAQRTETTALFTIRWSVQ